MGCRHGLSDDSVYLTCAFATSGFDFKNGRKALACHVRYHTKCIRAGPPFSSRRKDNAGMTFPAVTIWPLFICELFTVRAVLDRELHLTQDYVLLRLERMRILDMSHYWSPSTHYQYQLKLRFILRFQLHHQFSLLQSSPLKAPPSGSEIALQWIEESFSLRPASTRREEYVTVAVKTVESLRSALSYWYAWDMMVADPSSLFMTDGRLHRGNLRPTDTFSNTMFATGLEARIGTERKASFALLDRHIRGIDKYQRDRLRRATDRAVQRQEALAGFANLLFWLGWFRSSEGFSLRWEDFDITEPHAHASLNLPVNVGLIGCRLLPETKTNRSSTADVCMAYETLSGFQLGWWWHQILALRPPNSSSSDLIFTGPDGVPWTSRSYRHTYLFPCLYEQRANGDAVLKLFDDSKGNRIEDKFWAMHSFRIGARSQCQRGGMSPSGFVFRAASEPQVYEHGRWRYRTRQSGEKIDVSYRAWNSEDRIVITLSCQ